MSEDKPERPIAKLAAVLAGGSTVVVGIFAFLGITNETVQRVLREEPKASLLFGGMIAAGVTLGLVAQMLDLPGALPVVWVVIGGAAIIMAFPWIAKRAREADVPDTGNFTLIIVTVILAAAALIIFFGPLKLGSDACLLMLGGILFALGAYGTIRLPVDSLTTAATAEFGATSVVVSDDSPPRLAGSVSADGLRTCQSLTVVRIADPDEPVDTDPDKRVVIARGQGGPDGLATLTFDVLVPASWLEKELWLMATLNPPPDEPCTGDDGEISEFGAGSAYLAVAIASMGAANEDAGGDASTGSPMRGPSISAVSQGGTLVITLEGQTEATQLTAVVVADRLMDCVELARVKAAVESGSEYSFEMPVRVAKGTSIEIIARHSSDELPNPCPDEGPAEAAYLNDAAYLKIPG